MTQPTAHDEPSRTLQSNACSLAGGIALAAPTITLDVSAGNKLKFDANDTAWGSQTIAGIYGAYIYDTTVTNNLWALIYFGGTSYGVTSGVFTIQWHSSGIWVLDLTP